MHAFCKALLTTIAICISYSTIHNVTSLHDTKFLYLATVLACWLVFSCAKQTPHHPVFTLLSWLFATFYLFGMSFASSNSWTPLFGDLPSAILAGLCLWGWQSLFYALLACLYLLLRRLSNNAKVSPTEKQNRLGQRLFHWVEHHTFAFACAVIFLGWLPWIVAYSPGTIMFDTFMHLNGWFNLQPRTTHHPIVPSIVMGTLMQLGRWLGDDHWGVILYIVPQVAGMIVLFARTVCFMKEQLNAPPRFLLATVCWFAFFTVWPSYAMSEIKDTLFFCFVLVFTLQLMCVVQKGPAATLGSKEFLALFFATMLCVSFYRNNGIFLALFALASLLFLRWDRQWKVRIFLLLCATVITFQATTMILMSSLGYQRGGLQEALSIPFQQTARYVAQHLEDVTPAERNAIDGVLDYARLPSLYQPHLSDQVKDTYKFRLSKECRDEERIALKAYFSAWMKGLLKHPGTYIQATINNIYGYFYPEFTGLETGFYRIETKPVANTGFFNLHYFIKQNEFRLHLHGIMWRLTQFPATDFIYSCGTMTWLFFALMGFAIVNGKPSWIIPFVPGLTVMLICIACPANGYVRYYTPLFVTAFPLIAWTMCSYRNKPIATQPALNAKTTPKEETAS